MKTITAPSAEPMTNSLYLPIASVTLPEQRPRDDRHRPVPM